MNSKRKPYMLTNQNSTAFWLIDTLWMPLATSHHTQDKFSLLEQVCPVGGPQTHMHPTDEGMYILDGHVTFQVGGQEVKAGPGTFASIPRYTEHSFVVDRTGTRVLNFYTPGGFETMIMSLGIPAPERKIPEPGITPMPASWMVMEASREFGQIGAPKMPFADPPTDEHRLTRASETNPTTPYSVELDRAPAFWLESSLYTVIATKEQTGGSYSLLHHRAPKDSGPPPHSHEQDEALYVLEGNLTVIAGEERFTSTAGSFVYIPEGTIHTFRVESEEAQLLNWYLPGGFEQVVQKGGVPATAREFPLEPVKSSQTAAQRRFLFEQVGMTVAAIGDSFRSKPEFESA